ncbi:MAG: hypothetical protein Q8R01_13550 [Ramlibacter sp.]|nr:hypothetical protein [Ramlibacter sp.]
MDKAESSGARVIALPTRMRWRARVGDLVVQAEDVMLEVKDVLLNDTMARHGTYAKQLIGDALSLLGDKADTLQRSDPSQCYGCVVLPAVAMLVGAQSMENVSPSLYSALQPAVAALEEAGRILDEAGLAQ